MGWVSKIANVSSIIITSRNSLLVQQDARAHQSRREIGHGALGERALAQIIPSEEDFPYTIRLVAEVFRIKWFFFTSKYLRGNISINGCGCAN